MAGPPSCGCAPDKSGAGAGWITPALSATNSVSPSTPSGSRGATGRRARIPSSRLATARPLNTPGTAPSNPPASPPYKASSTTCWPMVLSGSYTALAARSDNADSDAS